MSSTYNGNPASGAWSPAISVTEPADLDTLNAASVNSALSKLADFIAFLQANSAQKSNSNTWTAAQTFQALMSLTGNLAFSAAVAQTLLKTAAGGLTVGTAAGGGDLSLSANGTTLLKLLASGSLDAQAKVLSNLAAPVAAGDALSKVAMSWSSLTPTTYWSTGGIVYWKDAANIVHFRAYTFPSNAAASISIATLPVGFRPGNDWLMAGLINPGGSAYNFMGFRVTTAGVFQIADGGYTPVVPHNYLVTGSWPAEG